MNKIGLKLWSIGVNYIKDAVKLYNENFYDYIELYVVPNSYDQCLKLWKDLKIPYIIHAPHFKHGMNLSKIDHLNNNIRLSNEAKKWADKLESEFIIFHPGTEGNCRESAKQFKKIYDSRIVVENKPYYTFKDKLICCVGYNFEEIRYILSETNIGFCLDIGHAIAASNALELGALTIFDEMNKLDPVIYHLYDGDKNDVQDKHLNFGEGNYPFETIMNKINKKSLITIETAKKSDDNLDDFKNDMNFLNKFFFTEK